MSAGSSNVTPTVQGSVTAGNVAIFTADKQLADGGAPAGTGINQLTGDVTAGPGSGSQAATLANTAVTPGSYTTADITVDSKGRITAAANGSAGGGGTVTNTGTLTSGKLIQGNGSADVTVNATTATVTKLTSGTPSAATDGTDYLSPATGLTWIAQNTPTGTSTTFSSLGAFTHLRLMWSARGDQSATSTNMNLTFNGDTGSNYDRQLISANNTTVTGAESLGQTSAVIGSVVAATGTADLAAVGFLEIYDYRGTTFQKGGVSFDGLRRTTGTGNTFSREFTIGWRSTAAITSITITLASGNFVAGSKFTLYGLP